MGHFSIFHHFCHQILSNKYADNITAYMESDSYIYDYKYPKYESYILCS